ncbi:MAG TPA: nuclear transport factor 2 family protein [Kineosporiaceae bacterium]|jgi:ketosteroid isomerase-like protein|nr:nuclear transport factor 2 family protein [Kineosporiaceae bacterium]
MSESDVDAVINDYRQALKSFVSGNSQPVAGLFSRRDDVTLANPLGPPHRGGQAVEDAFQTAAALFKAGSVAFEEVSRYVTRDLAYVVQIERSESQLVGSDDTVVISLRVTMIFRPEDGTWKVVHRHADPITSARPISSTIDVTDREART